jgi:hypothetical protein
MKKIALTLLLLWQTLLHGQNIVKMEYWVDVDPGFGKATNISGINKSSDISAFNFLIPPALPVGNHIIGIRSMDATGKWSHTNYHFVQIADSSKGQIVEIEYFWDTDPGIGKGIIYKVDTPLASVKTNSLPVAVPASLSIGFHNLFLRSRDNRGRWSHINYLGQIELYPLASDTAFIDTTVCSGFISPRGNLYTISGVYKESRLVSSPQYQIAIYTLTVKPVNLEVTQNGNILTANENGATYKWVDCNNNYKPIAGATSKTFTATKAGNYAVIVDKNGCVDTSLCLSVAAVSVPLITDVQANVELYPNPNTGAFQVKINDVINGDAFLTICDITGKKVFETKLYKAVTEIELNTQHGLYFATVYYNQNEYKFKIIRY